MSLTNDDLLAIKQIMDQAIDTRVPKIIDERVPVILKKLVPDMIDERLKKLVPDMIDERVPGVVQPMLDGLEKRLEERLVKRIDDLDDSLSMQMEKGLQEVRGQLDDVKDTVGRIERQQRAMVEQLDDHATRLVKVERKLKLQAA